MRPWQFAGRPVELGRAPALEGAGFSARLIDHGSLEMEMAALPRHRLSIALGRRPNVWTDILGAKSAQDLGCYHANIIPAEHVAWIDDPTPGRCLYIEIDADTGGRFPGDRFAPAPAFNWYDARLASISTYLLSALCSPTISNDLLSGSIENEIALSMRSLSRQYSSIDKRRPIDPWRMRQLIEFINAHLHEQMTVMDLAWLIDLQVPEFLARFYATFRVPPFRYVNFARIRDVCTRLIEPDATPQSVARTLGYDLIELERTFMTELGMPMGKYRSLRLYQ